MHARAGQKRPAAHGIGAVAPAGQYLPAGHSIGVAAPGARYVPHTGAQQAAEKSGSHSLSSQVGEDFGFLHLWFFPLYQVRSPEL